MPQLSAAGQQLVQNLANRHGLSKDAVLHMLIAIQNGNGSMAQFNHQEFGGGGQWMRGGMTMVSDLFNNQLKYRVDSICNDIANELNNHQLVPFTGSFQSQSQNGNSGQMQAAGGMGSANSLFIPDPEANWWPQDLGAPNALGSQNNVKYAYFGNSRRLAVKTGSDVWVYDTLNHNIGGFGQQQGLGGTITFSSQYGTVNLGSLPIISRNGVNSPVEPIHQAQPAVSISIPQEEAPAKVMNAQVPIVPTSQSNPLSKSVGHENVLETLEKLGELRDKGYISEAEFNAKKAELLQRL